jgi:two-component system, LytTR family, response regulator
MTLGHYLSKNKERPRLGQISSKQFFNTLQQPPYQNLIAKAYLFITVQKKKVRVLFADIVYIESQREYIKIIATQATYLSKMGTHEIEALLPTHLFKRVHRSFIVSLDKITAYTAEAVELRGGLSIPIGRGYRDALEGL